MTHPFNLNLTELQTLDLEFEEALTDTAAHINGGNLATTLAVGEEGGDWLPRCPYPTPSPKPHPRPVPIDPPIMTTMALGEEGGCPPPPVSRAWGEHGGGLDW